MSLPEPSRRMPPRILLVEDDPVSRDVLASLLAARGDEVDGEADGSNALRCAQERPHDLIFIDYHLPKMDGYALARLMRTLTQRGGVAPVMVAITADSFGLAARRGAGALRRCPRTGRRLDRQGAADSADRRGLASRRQGQGRVRKAASPYSAASR